MRKIGKNILSINYYKTFSQDIKLLLYPILIVSLYEIFHIKSYSILSELPQYMYFYFLFGQAVGSYIAGILSDKFSRCLLLNLFFCVGITEFFLIYISYNELAIIISPLFASTAVAKAAMVDNHRHISIKNIMCIAWIFVFIPWCMFRVIEDNNSSFFILFLIILSFFSLLKFKDLKDLNKKETKEVTQKKNFFKLLLISLSISLAQFVFFLIIVEIESFKFGDNLFEFIGLGSLLGTLLALFSNGRHKDMIYSSFAFLFLISFCSSLTLFYFGELSWRSTLGAMATFGGFYLPIITEQLLLLKGENKRGEALGLLELIIGISSILAVSLISLVKLSPATTSILILSLTFFIIVSYKSYLKSHENRKNQDGRYKL